MTRSFSGSPAKWVEVFNMKASKNRLYVCIFRISEQLLILLLIWYCYFDITWPNSATVELTSFILCCSQLHKNVPNRQLYRWSRMVTRKYSLNSNADGNFRKNKYNGSFRILKWEEIWTQFDLFLTCLVNCQTQSTNWIKTGERSASVWFLSPCPIRLVKCQIWGQSVEKRHLTCHRKCWKWIFIYQLEAVTEAQPLFLE